MAFDPSVNDSVSVAENISVAVDDTPTAWVADVISLSEYIDVAIAGEGAGEVEGGFYTIAEIGAVGIFTKAIIPRRTSNRPGYLNISISGTFVASVVLQRSFDGGVTWNTYATYTTVTESSLTDLEIGVRYRLGIPTSYTSGTAICRLGIGR